MITVMTLNVGNGLARPEQLVAWLKVHGMDVVGLQELDAGQAAAIERGLESEYPWMVLHPSGFEGRGLLSRYPLLDHDLPMLRPGRSDLSARLATPGVETNILVAHPLPPRPGRRGVVADVETSGHIDRIIDLALGERPAIVMGDFNMTMRNPLYERLRSSGLIDAFTSSGRGRGSTFPVRPGKMRSLNHRMHWLPLPAFTRLDYIWHTTELTTLESWVGPNAGSDHLPLLATLLSNPDGASTGTTG